MTICHRLTVVWLPEARVRSVFEAGVKMPFAGSGYGVGVNVLLWNDVKPSQVRGQHFTKALGIRGGVSLPLVRFRRSSKETTASGHMKGHDRAAA